uniref:Retrovirus-related Pol polyprotein from transposon TNT 1-94 n=1 Tax=Angiostrongylus cantonensis TaxID=6313 RepID=A0A0K0DJP4_ANGCA
MCAHIRRSDFVEMNVASDFNASVRDIHEIASDQVNKNLVFMVFQKVKYSMNSEGVDLYLASKVCSAMLITAPTSTFGWWLAFFIRNQNAVFYSNDNRTMVDKTPRKDLFLCGFIFDLKHFFSKNLHIIMLWEYAKKHQS